MIKRHTVEIDSHLANIQIETHDKHIATRLELACEHVLKEFDEKQSKNEACNGD